MSWFSREWDGVHLEGCPFYAAETMEVPPGETVAVEEIEDSRWRVIPDDACTCPELLLDQHVGHAEMLRDAAREGF